MQKSMSLKYEPASEPLGGGGISLGSDGSDDDEVEILLLYSRYRS